MKIQLIIKINKILLFSDKIFLPQKCEGVKRHFLEGDDYL